MARIRFLVVAALLGSLVVAAPRSAQGDQGIDVHVHLESDGGRAAILRLLDMMDRQGIARAILMPPPQIPGQKSPHSFETLDKLRSLAPDRLAVAGGGESLNRLLHEFDPDGVTEEVRARFRQEALRLADRDIAAFGELAVLHLSFNEHHVFEQTTPDHPLMLTLAEVAQERGIPIDLHMEVVPQEIPLPDGFARRSSRNPPRLQANVEGLERLLAYREGARIVWQHIGWDNTGYLTPALLRGLLQRHPNLFLALRVEDRPLTVGGQPMPNRVVDGAGRIRPEWLTLIQDYPDRFMLGCDEFVSASGRGRYPRSLVSTWSLLRELPPDLAERVGFRNAARIYRLNSGR